MKVTIDLPEDVSAALKGQWDVPKRSLEAIAVEGYRIGALTETQVRRVLQLDTRFQVHALLEEHHVPLRYTEADLEDVLCVSSHARARQANVNLAWNPHKNVQHIYRLLVDGVAVGDPNDTFPGFTCLRCATRIHEAPTNVVKSQGSSWRIDG